MRSVTVVRTGPQALVQDLGRPGLAHLGVPPSGAVDQPALRLANRLVGNPEDAAGIESVLGGLVLRPSCRCTIAVTGAPSNLRLTAGSGSGSDSGSASGGSGSGGSAEFGTAVHLAPGDVLRIGTPSRGLRCYVAISGGLAVPAELGSRSTDVLSGIGPPPLANGDHLPLGDPIAEDGPNNEEPAQRASADDPDRNEPAQRASDVELPVMLGPRDEWFTDAAAQLAAGQWTVSPTSNRIGVRLDGTALRRTARFDDVELPTEPLVTGAVQVPPSGEPLIFLNDHPTTGGYPVIAVVDPRALPMLAQARPGATVHLRP